MTQLSILDQIKPYVLTAFEDYTDVVDKIKPCKTLEDLKPIIHEYKYKFYPKQTFANPKAFVINKQAYYAMNALLTTLYYVKE